MVEGRRRIGVVTGASGGVGRGIAIGLASNDWDVCVNYFTDRDGAEETPRQVVAAGASAWLYRADVGESAEVSGMFRQIAIEAGRIDLLVNNAGVQTWASLTELAEEDWDRTIRTNLKGRVLVPATSGSCNE